MAGLVSGGRCCAGRPGRGALGGEEAGLSIDEERSGLIGNDWTLPKSLLGGGGVSIIVGTGIPFGGMDAVDRPFEAIRDWKG